MPSLDEARLRVQNTELRQALRDVLAMTRGAQGSADVEVLRRACRLADVELPPAREQFIAGGRVEVLEPSPASGAFARRTTG